MLGEAHPDTATSLNNLGMLLKVQGELVGARSCLEQALAICEQVLGSVHPMSQIVLRNLVGLDSPTQTPV